MKLFLCVIIVFLSGLIGANIKNEICKKYQIFKEIHAFLQFASIKIAFFKDYYADFIKEFINSQQLKNKQIFNLVLKLINSNNFTLENFSKSVAKYNLDNEETKLLYNIFSSIGSTDIINQEQILQGNIKQIEYKISELDEQKKHKGNMASKLSICIGLVICILIY